MLRSQDIQFFIFKPFSTNVPLLYPLKHQKTSVFLMFSGGIEVKHCLKMGYPANIRLDEEVLKTSFAFVFRRRLQDVLIKTNIFTILIRLQKTSSRRLDQDQYIRLGHMSSRRLQDVFRRLAKISSKHLQDVLEKRLQDIFKTSSRHLQDVLQRCLQGAFRTYYQVTPFLLISFQDVFKTYSQRFWGLLQRRLSTEGFRSDFWEIYDQCTKFARGDNSFSSFSFSLYYTL